MYKETIDLQAKVISEVLHRESYLRKSTGYEERENTEPRKNSEEQKQSTVLLLLLFSVF